MLFRINAPERGDLRYSEPMMQAYSAWMALHSIDLADRATLGVDLSRAPALLQRVIPLPDEPICTIETGSMQKNEMQFKRKRETARMVADTLKDITGHDYQYAPGAINNMHSFRKILEHGNREGNATAAQEAVFMVGNGDDIISGDQSFYEDNVLLIQDNVRTARASYFDVRAKRVGEGTMANTRDYVAARVDTTPVAMLEADDTFIKFYTNPDLLKALKDHKDKMVTAKEMGKTAPNRLG